MRVKGSWRRREQAQQEREGARKVMTVASARGRYWRESGERLVGGCGLMERWVQREENVREK
jgi:hypothetical protein